ncbi:MAG TPA: hypothetical protein VF226_01480 [Hyphomicrobiaceae bacterium]
MTNRNDSSKTTGKPASEGSGPKKPSALLDLKATEVTSKDVKPPAPSTSTTASAAAGSGGSAKEAEPKGSPAPASSPAAANVENSPGATSGAPKPAASQTSSSGTSKPGTQSAEKQTVQQPAGKQDAAKSSAQQETTPAATPKRSGSGLSIVTHLTAGIAGGFLALLLADAVGPQFGLGNRVPQQVVSDLQQRLTAAEQAIRQRSAIETVSPQEFQQKLAEVESRLAHLDEVDRKVGELSDNQAKIAAETTNLADRVNQSAPAEVTERIAKLEQVLSTLTAAAGSDEPGRIPQLAAISGKLADLEATIPNQLTELRKSVSEEIATRLSETAEASEAARAATLRMDRELAAAKADLARLSQRAEALKATDDRLEQLLRAVQEEAGSLRSTVEGLQGELATQLKTVARAQDVTAAVAPVEGRVAALEQNVQAVVRSEEDRRANAERIVLALELGNLKRALDRGGSYAAELGELRRISAGKIDLAVLERYKDEGVPTLAALQKEFRPVANAVIDAASVPADASPLDRLLIGAKAIVRVRRVEHSPDDTSVEAIVGRMEQALAEGKFTDVLDQARLLPPKSLEPAEAWLAKVEARAAVDRALASVEDQLKASLSGQAAVEKRTN